MNHQTIKKVLLIFLVLIFWINGMSYAALHISLRKALESKMVNLKAISVGGYCGKCIKLSITNQSKTALDLAIEPALIFRPSDTSYQDLVLLGNESLAIAPGATHDITLQTFCGKSYAHSPVPGIDYTYWKQGEEAMVKTLTYVKDSSIDMWTCQHAVWMFTNHHSLSSVYSYSEPEKSARLVKYIAALKHLPIPDHYTKYHINEHPHERICDKKIEKQFVELRWGLEHKHMYLTIYNENGSVYKRLDGGAIVDKYGVRMVVEFDPKKDPKGKYRVELRDDDNVICYNKEVTIGYDD